MEGNQENFNSIMENALLALLDGKPQDPINFLTTHFEMQCENSNVIVKALNLLQGMTLEHPALDERLLTAYSTVSVYSMEGVTGEVFTDLLTQMAADVPQCVSKKFLSRMKCRATEYVSFAVFRFGVLTCLYFNQFVEEATHLFSSLCGNNQDFAPALACSKALKKLSESLHQPHPQKAPAKKRASKTKKSQDREYVKLNAFLSDAIDIFVKDIPNLKSFVRE